MRAAVMAVFLALMASASSSLAPGRRQTGPALYKSLGQLALRPSLCSSRMRQPIGLKHFAAVRRLSSCAPGWSSKAAGAADPGWPGPEEQVCRAGMECMLPPCPHPLQMRRMLRDVTGGVYLDLPFL